MNIKTDKQLEKTKKVPENTGQRTRTNTRSRRRQPTRTIHRKAQEPPSNEQQRKANNSKSKTLMGKQRHANMLIHGFPMGEPIGAKAQDK